MAEYKVVNKATGVESEVAEMEMGVDYVEVKTTDELVVRFSNEGQLGNLLNEELLHAIVMIKENIKLI